MKIDENLAAVHAYLCADGYVIKNPEGSKYKYYILGFRNTNLTLLKDFQDKFEKVFGLRPHLDEGQRCRIGSKKFYEILTKSFGSFYSWHWKMPKLNRKLSRIWLRAYFDCEGWVTCKSHQNRMIGADCVNKVGIKQIKEELDKLGIKSKIKKRSTRNIFSLAIFGRENLIKFNENVGFIQPDKKEKISKVLLDFVDYDWKFPDVNSRATFIKEILKQRAKIKKPEGIIRIISKLEKNLLILQRGLYNLFEITCKVNKMVNGIGTIYYQLNINKHEDVRKIVSNNLLNEEQQKKWLNLKK
jgi:hypothetical protein